MDPAPLPPTPPQRKLGTGLIILGLLFIVLGCSNHSRRAYLGVGVVFMAIGIRRNRTNPQT